VKKAGIIFITFIIVVLIMLSVSFGNDDIEKAKKTVQKLFPNSPIASFEKTPIEGMYEMAIGNNIIYVFPEKGYLFFGELWTKDGKNITAESRQRLMSARLKNLPLDLAIKIGNGRHQVIEFSDPDCPFCRKAYSYFSTLPEDRVTKYVFLYPLEKIHPEARKKALYILCNDNPEKAYDEAFSGKLDGNVQIPESCNLKEKESLLNKHIETALSMGVTGTPAFYIDGKYVAGADIPRIESLIK